MENKEYSLYVLYKNLWHHLQIKMKIQISLVFLLSLFVSLTEFFSIASLLPFITIFTDIDRALSNNMFLHIINFLNLNTNEEIYLFATIFFCLITFIAMSSKVILVISNVRVSNKIGTFLVQKLFNTSIRKRYDTLLDIDLTDIVSIISTKSNTIASSVFISVITIINATFIIIFIIIGMFYLNPLLPLVIFSTIGTIYIIIMILVRKNLRQLNKVIVELHPEVLKVLKDSFAGIKEVIIFGLHNYYSQKFAKADRSLRHVIGSKSIISQLPRILIEGSVIITIALLIWVFINNSYSIMSNLPIIGTVIIGLQRLLPNFQGIYTGWTQMTGSKLEVMEIYQLLNQPTNFINVTSKEIEFFDFSKLEMNSVSFRYKDNEDFIFKNINLTINKGEKIAIIGSSGIGKSCLLDIMLGFLEPKKGSIKVNNKEINKHNVNSWQKVISYVPQDVFLRDASLFENITFINDKSLFKEDRLINVIKKSRLHETIKVWKNGWDRFLGERGRNISGGQRQRVGIARALYKESQILFLDEATSALDSKMEKEVISALTSDYPNLTIIAITHRLELLECFDKVFEIKNKDLIKQL